MENGEWGMGNGETLPIEHTLPIREFVAINSCTRGPKFGHSGLIHSLRKSLQRKSK